MAAGMSVWTRLDIWHGYHTHTPIGTLSCPPLLFWLGQNSQRLPFGEGKVFLVTANKVIEGTDPLASRRWLGRGRGYNTSQGSYQGGSVQVMQAVEV